jgi:hypothetical protein
MVLRCFIYGINVSAITAVLFFVGYTNTDKSVLIFLLFYPILLVFNFVLLLVVKKAMKPVVKKLLLVELLLFLPLFGCCVCCF